MSTSWRRVLVLVLVPLALFVGACADDGELGGPGVGGTLAARVGSSEITNADLETETELWASNPEFLQAIGMVEVGAPGRRASELTAFVLSHRVVSEQAALLGADAGYEPTETEIDEILLQIDQSFGPVFAAYPDAFRRQLGRDLAFQNNLQAMGPDFTAPPVEINPRYGTPNLLQGGLVEVVPPEGPRVPGGGPTFEL